MTSAKMRLTSDQIAEFCRQLDELELRVAGDLANRDLAGVQDILDSQQVLEMDDRGPLMDGIFPACWRAESTMLAALDIVGNTEDSPCRVNPVYAFLLMVLFKYSLALRNLESQRTGSAQIRLADKRGALGQVWVQSKSDLIARHFVVGSRVSADR
ncbi:MAG: hypothetical protein EKK34_21000 [Mycobacterium sp.]|nr:MAG: hypothetical protein EKK34_21000 [Mycobacterium sp.]